MIDVTDRHFRMLIRCISPLPVLYTEMTWDRAILYNTPGEPEYALNKTGPMGVDAIIGFSDAEQPLVMQLGGAEPANLARAAAQCVERGYEEINLNCGCPAQTRGRAKNCYGARLMFEPERVAACCAAMIEAVGGAAEITVKCRLGVNSQDSWEELKHFIATVAASGVRHFIVHARKAILGLNTIQNRSVPPLRHEWVSLARRARPYRSSSPRSYLPSLPISFGSLASLLPGPPPEASFYLCRWVYRLTEEFPHLLFTLNGGVGSVDEVAQLLSSGQLHGVMLGRRSNADPYLYARCGVLYSGEAGVSRREVLDSYLTYAGVALTSNWERLPVTMRLDGTPMSTLEPGGAALASY